MGPAETEEKEEEEERRRATESPRATKGLPTLLLSATDRKT